MKLRAEEKIASSVNETMLEETCTFMKINSAMAKQLRYVSYVCYISSLQCMTITSRKK